MRPASMLESLHEALLLALGLAAVSLACGCVEDLCPAVGALPGGPADPAGGPPSILSMGDSIMAMNAAACQNVAGHAGLLLDQYVEDRSVGGRRLDHPDSDDDILGQYEPGPWEWVIMTGGGNDLIQECGCNQDGHDAAACAEVLDRLLDPEAGSGEILDLLAEVRAGGEGATAVLLLGYYPFRDDSLANFDGCNGYLPELNARWAALAETEPDLTFVDTSEAMDLAAHPERTWIDGIHPSPEGSEALGALVAEAIGAP